ncbi:hypothetical protein V6N13_048840 [Hibiscus sabdariffa]|uniref:Uncharacterized protein n=1 Tax=Hibiscus sabdariffa TaxID=183260 RepID=A0ABR2DIC7_9ROSI
MIKRGSRFSILQDAQEVEVDTFQTSDIMEPQPPFGNSGKLPIKMSQAKETIASNINGEGCSKDKHQQKEVVTPRRSRETAMELDENINGLASEGVGDLELEAVKELASNEPVEVWATSLNKENHTVVRIGGTSETHGHKKRSGRVLSASIRGGVSKTQTKAVTTLKGGQRQGSKPKKKDDRGLAKPVFPDRIAALVSELENAKATKIANSRGNKDECIQWHENGMFGQPGGNLGEA